jgi:hypothetical protein
LDLAHHRGAERLFSEFFVGPIAVRFLACHFASAKGHGFAFGDLKE